MSFHMIKVNIPEIMLRYKLHTMSGLFLFPSSFSSYTPSPPPWRQLCTQREHTVPEPNPKWFRIRNQVQSSCSCGFPEVAGQQEYKHEKPTDNAPYSLQAPCPLTHTLPTITKNQTNKPPVLLCLSIPPVRLSPSSKPAANFACTTLAFC